MKKSPREENEKNEWGNIKLLEVLSRRSSLNQDKFHKKRMKKMKRKELSKKQYKRTFQN